MAESKSPKSQKKKERNANLSDTLQNHLEEKSPSLKRKPKSSSEDEVALKKSKSAVSKVTNGQVDATDANSKWTLEDEEALLDKVQEYLTNREDGKEVKKPFYIKNIEWNKIDCGDHSPQDVQHKFLALSNRVRKMRTASEILEDMKEDHAKKKKKKIREKKESDPDLPKKPLSSYMRFVVAKRHGIVERHPEMKNIDVTRKLGSKWKKLSEEKKKKYSDGYHEEMENYTLQLIEYLRAHNPGVSPPKTRFELWAEEEKKKIKEDRPDISEKKLAKKLKRRWENLEEEEKAKWEDKEKRELKKFRDRISRSSKSKSEQEQKLHVESSPEENKDV